jgi:two-component sensor histidine kinase
VPLVEVIAQAIAPFDASRFVIDPALEGVMAQGDMAIGMGLLLYEMATNAVKYGALSNSRGRVAIGPEPAGEDRAAFHWRETGGPEVAATRGSGFGTRLLNQVLRPLGGEVKFDFEPHGFHACVEFPIVR